MYSPRLYKSRDSYVLYKPTIHTFGTVNLTHTLLVQTPPHDVSTPCFEPPRVNFTLHTANIQGKTGQYAKPIKSPSNEMYVPNMKTWEFFSTKELMQGNVFQRCTHFCTAVYCLWAEK